MLPKEQEHVVDEIRLILAASKFPFPIFYFFSWLYFPFFFFLFFFFNVRKLLKHHRGTELAGGKGHTLGVIAFAEIFFSILGDSHMSHVGRYSQYLLRESTQPGVGVGFGRG